MRLIRAVAAVAAVVFATGEPSAAQTITVFDNRDPRASLRVGYGGHGLDWETSIDSPLLANRFRFRAGLGEGRWDSEFDSSANPRVTRLAASALVFIPQPYTLKPYIGLGIARFSPRDSDARPQRGTRVILGMEGSGERWTVGMELELDLPHPNSDPRVRGELYPTARLGLALRRSF